PLVASTSITVGGQLAPQVLPQPATDRPSIITVPSRVLSTAIGERRRRSQQKNRTAPTLDGARGQSSRDCRLRCVRELSLTCATTCARRSRVPCRNAVDRDRPRRSFLVTKDPVSGTSGVAARREICARNPSVPVEISGSPVGQRC